MTTRLPVYDPVRKERYVQQLTLGLSPVQAATVVGFTNPKKAVAALKKDETVQAMLEAYRLEMAERYRFDRDKAVAMLMDAYQMAKLEADPKGMVASVRELNEMHGFHAPKQLEASVTHEQAATGSRRALAELSDEELMAQGGLVLDGEFEEEASDDAAA